MNNILNRKILHVHIDGFIHHSHHRNALNANLANLLQLLQTPLSILACMDG